MIRRWVVLSKEEGSDALAHSNVVVAPSAGLEVLAEAALHHEPSPQLLSVSPTAQHDSSGGSRGYDPRLDEMLEAVGCSLELAPGDAVFLAEDTYHRTQDLLVNRVAMLINVE